MNITISKYSIISKITLAIFTGLLLVAINNSAHGQAVSIPGVSTGMGYGVFNYIEDGSSWLSPKTFAPRKIQTRPTRDYTGPNIAGWDLTPQITLSPTWTDNLYLSNEDRASGYGIRAQPNFKAIRDTGLHRTRLYFIGDGSIFPSESNYNLVNASTGITHLWHPQNDLLIKFNAQVDRITTLYGPGNLLLGSSGLTGLVSSPALASTLGNNSHGVSSFQHWTMYGGSASVMKSFDLIFTGTTIGSFVASFDPISVSSNSLIDTPVRRNDNLSYVVNRTGISLTPIAYIFTDNSANIRQFSTSGTSYYGNINTVINGGFANANYNTNGFRNAIGFGFDRTGPVEDRKGLWRGEIYGGYQEQQWRDTKSASASIPIYGGRLNWYPTPAWTVFGSIDRFYQDFIIPVSTGNQIGNPWKVTAMQAGVSYAMSRRWSATMIGGYYKYAVIGSNNNPSNFWMGRLMLQYELTRSFSLVGQYDFFGQVTSTYNANSQFVSNTNNNQIFNGNFARNQVSIGVSYKY